MDAKRIKLKKIEIMPREQLQVLPADKLVELTVDLFERIDMYQALLFKARKQRFGPSSEKSNSDDTQPSEDQGIGDEQPTSAEPLDPPAKAIKDLSERYPDATQLEEKIDFETPPCCDACGHSMQDSGMTEQSKYLDIIEKKYVVYIQSRSKYRCGHCHSGLKTAPAPPRITPGGSYSDNLIIDATLSKYCDLIPLERYADMALREGLAGLPPHSLIAVSMKLAQFLFGVYAAIRSEVLETRVLMADETPHRMLEGSKIKRWYLWGFFSQHACYFECHDTRSGGVAVSFLQDSKCEVLLTDVYSGYGKSVRVINEQRERLGLELVKEAHCNAHARRKFKDKDSDEACEEADWFIQMYAKIYALNKESKDQDSEIVLSLRKKMRPIFEEMMIKAESLLGNYSSHSQLYKACTYFLNNYNGLTLFLEDPDIPIDNNFSERGLRSSVIGRKTWYGTHSERGAITMAIHYTLVESCKSNGVNPRAFYKDAVQRIHNKLEPLTPAQYKRLKATQSS